MNFVTCDRLKFLPNQQLGGFGGGCFLYPVEMIRILPVVWRNKGVKQEAMSYIVFCLRYSNPSVPSLKFQMARLVTATSKLERHLAVARRLVGRGSSK